MTEHKKQKLPTLANLNSKPEEAYKNDVLNTLLSNEPPKSWVKNHPFAKGVKYIPIQYIENCLLQIFQKYRVEVMEYKQLFNSVTCHVRIHYVNPISGEWEYHDGLGACSVQTDKGKSASDLSAIKSDAVMKALPASKSYALKDAAEHLGKLFGRDLNRKETMAFSPKYSQNHSESLD